MIMKFKKGKSYEVVGGDGYSIVSPSLWYKYTDGWKIAEVDTTNATDNYKRIFLRVKLKGGTSYLMGQGYNYLADNSVFDGKIWLFDINGNELASDDHAHKEINGEVFQDCVEYTPSADGVYILACGSFTYNGRSGKFPICCYPAPEQEPQGVVYETSSGFNAMGKPIRYRSASGCGINYFTLPVKDGLVFCSNYKKGAIDTVSKASAECNNVVFEKYNGVDCAYFNGTSSSIVWKNVLTKSLTKYTLVVKFACTYTNGSWSFLFGVSPENDRGQGCSLQMHNEYGNRFYFLWGNQDYSVASNVEKEVFHVGILSVDNGLVKCYLDNNLVYNGNLGAIEIPSTSLLYVGGDYGQSYRLWFEGYIAQSILYDRALNEDEVKALSEV